MINLTNMNKQHGRIKEEVASLENEIKKGIENMNPSELALHINYLAGQLKVHLLEEDEFLYPNLIKCGDVEIQNMADEYNNEMGSLVSDYTGFKSQYNTSNKISADKETFMKEIKRILKALNDRIAKEDNGLYHLIETKGI